MSYFKKYKIFLYDSNPHGKKFGRKIINTKWHISAGIFLLMITRSTTVSYQSCQNIMVVWIDHALLESLYTKEDEWIKIIMLLYRDFSGK